MSSSLLLLQSRGLLLRGRHLPALLATSAPSWLQLKRENSSRKQAGRWQHKSQLPFQSELRNPVALLDDKPHVENGHLYDRKPFKVSVKKYHVYEWCGCGMSSSQPFCDRTHANRYIKGLIKGGPVRYIAPEDRDIWFCNCKQTSNRPFCDGTHRQDSIQAERLEGKPETVWEPTSQ